MAVTGGAAGPSTSPPEPDDDDELPEVNLGLLAAMTTVYAFAEGLVTYPYDLVKTRQQVSCGSAAHEVHTSTGVHMLKIRREGGVRALYRGFGWSLLGGIPSEVVYYVSYTPAPANAGKLN